MNGRIAVCLWEGCGNLGHLASSRREGGSFVWTGVYMAHSKFIWPGAQKCMPHHDPRVHFGTVRYGEGADVSMTVGYFLCSPFLYVCRTVQSSR